MVNKKLNMILLALFCMCPITFPHYFREFATRWVLNSATLDLPTWVMQRLWLWWLPISSTSSLLRWVTRWWRWTCCVGVLHLCCMWKALFTRKTRNKTQPPALPALPAAKRNYRRISLFVQTTTRRLSLRCNARLVHSSWWCTELQRWINRSLVKNWLSPFRRSSLRQKISGTQWQSWRIRSKISKTRNRKRTMLWQKRIKSSKCQPRRSVLLSFGKWHKPQTPKMTNPKNDKNPTISTAPTSIFDIFFWYESRYGR